MHTIDGKILEFPQEFILRCERVKPLGQDIVKEFNSSGCIVATKVYLIYYEGQVLGNRNIKTLDEFLLLRNSGCNFVIGCPLVYNGCTIVYRGCTLTYLHS